MNSVSEQSNHYYGRTRSPIVLWYERVLWGLFLLALTGSAFIPGRISNLEWQLISPIFFLIAVFALPIGLTRTRHFFRRDVAWIILFFTLALGTLILPALITVESPFHLKIYPLGDRPVWFTPEFVWALRPEMVKLVFSRDVMILAAFVSVIFLCRNRTRLKLLLSVFSLVTVIHCLIAVYAWQGGIHLVEIKELDGHFGAMRGLFVNRNHFASFILIGTLGAWVGLIYAQARYASLPLGARLLRFTLSPVLLHASLIALVFVCLLMSESRAGFGGFVLVSILLLTSPSFKQKWSAKSKPTTWRNLILALIAVLVSSVLALLYGDGLINRLTSAGGLLGERPLQWWITLQAILDQPLIGYGAGSYAIVFEYYRFGFELRDVIFDQAHNDFLHVLLEQGLIGLIAYLALLTVTLRFALIYLRNTRSRLRFALLDCVLIIAAAVLLQALVDFNLQIVRIRLFFFVSLALVFVMSQYDFPPAKKQST